MKTLIIAPAFLTICLLLQGAPTAQAKADGLDTLKTRSGKSAAVAMNYQHRLFPTSKRNVYRLAVASPEGAATEMRVYDSQGNVVHKAAIQKDTVLCDLDVMLLQPGEYTLKLTSGQLAGEEKFTVE